VPCRHTHPQHASQNSQYSAGPRDTQIRLCDIHAHLADERLDDSRDRIVEEARRAGVAAILVNAARACEWNTVLQLAQGAGVYAALGIHPFFIGDWQEDTTQTLDKLLRTRDEVRAVGEIGLDFYNGREDADAQIEIFSAQIECALRSGRPVIVHNRKSWSEFFAVLKHTDLSGPAGVCHHFTGSREVARQALDAGFYLSFCGPLTYPNARRIKDAARYAPLDRILAETDTPDLPAEPFRGEQSRPEHVRWILQEIAHIKAIPLEDIAYTVEQNFRTVLQLETPSA
jgi:TatD DNase family protein